MPVLYVPVLFLMPMLGAVMGNWPFGQLSPGVADDFNFVWIIVYPALHVLSLIFVAISWFSGGPNSIMPTHDGSHPVDDDSAQSDNPYSPPTTIETADNNSMQRIRKSRASLLTAH